MNKPLVAVCVEDLMFRSKIEATAKHLGLTIAEASGQTAIILLDLNHKKIDAIAMLKQFKADPATAHVPVLGFLSHVQTDLKRQAVEAGCNLVVPRSVFSAQLPQLLSQYTKARLPNPA